MLVVRPKQYTICLQVCFYFFSEAQDSNRNDGSQPVEQQEEKRDKTKEEREKDVQAAKPLSDPDKSESVALKSAKGPSVSNPNKWMFSDALI